MPARDLRSILVIDPNPKLRSFVSAILMRVGHAVRQAGSVRHAGDLLRREPAQVLVTDLAMRERNNSETLEALHREFPDLEIVTISSGPHSTGYLRLAATLGASRAVAQRFMSRELKALLKGMVAGAAAYKTHADYRASRSDLSRN